ncbi:NADP oxidoreductase [marine bacterium AO1-C]|nr:NADP oxidoreductase [marine bacterium AO1-C]
MKIGILGTGMVGQIIAAKLESLQHEVWVGTRDVAKTLAKTENDAYGNPPFATWHQDHPEVKLTTFADATAQSEGLVLNCTSGQVSLSVLQMVGEDLLNDKILVDIANPLDFSQGMPPSLNPVNTNSLGETLQTAFPSVKVVKTLNTMNAHVMVNPGRIKGDHSVFVSGNDDVAKTTVTDLLKTFGWQASNIIDLGDISTARGTEMMLPIWLRLYGALGTPEFNFHVQKA